ncbi:MAG TPA: DUF4034 domain-containing protein [Burkholderiales bacterium]
MLQHVRRIVFSRSSFRSPRLLSLAAAALLALPAAGAPAQGAQAFYPWSQVQNKCRNPPTEDGRMVCRQPIAQDKANDWGTTQNIFDHIVSTWRDAPQFLDRAFNDIALEEPRYQVSDMKGEYKLPIALAYLEAEFGIDWEANLKKIRAWEAASPRSVYPYIVEASYWTKYAMNARGLYYPGQIRRETWLLMMDRLKNADAALEKARGLDMVTPPWTAAKLRVLWLHDPRAAHTLWQQAIKKWPAYYPLYDNAFDMVMPRFGGNAEAMERIVRESVDNTRATMGEAMYTRLYAHAAEDPDVDADLFTDTRARWPEFKSGIADLARIGSPLNPDYLMARFGCYAHDRGAVLEGLNKLHARGQRPGWPGQMSGDACAAWAQRS